MLKKRSLKKRKEFEISKLLDKAISNLDIKILEANSENQRKIENIDQKKCEMRQMICECEENLINSYNEHFNMTEHLAKIASDNQMLELRKELLNGYIMEQ